MSLDRKLGKLAEFTSNDFPFISLYLNTQADQHGRDNFDSFVRKEFSSRAKAFADSSPERESFERDAGRWSRRQMASRFLPVPVPITISKRFSLTRP